MATHSSVCVRREYNSASLEALDLQLGFVAKGGKKCWWKCFCNLLQLNAKKSYFLSQIEKDKFSLKTPTKTGNIYD